MPQGVHASSPPGHERQRGLGAAPGQELEEVLAAGTSAHVRELAAQHGLRFFISRPLRPEGPLVAVRDGREG